MEKNHIDFLEEVRSHRHRLEKRIVEHMHMDENARSTSSLGDMIDCWERLYKVEKKLSHCSLAPADMTAWVDGMKNADGSKGAHWTKEQTTAAARSSGAMIGHISQEDFWVAMNMMYSDFSPVAEKYGVNKPEFYAEMAKAFLHDKDGPDPEDKLAAYYRAIICHEK